jgi:hypothetical protein
MTNEFNPCKRPDDDCFLTPQVAHALTSVGVSPDLVDWGSFLLFQLILLISALLACILFWRRSRDVMALIVAFFLVIYPKTNYAQVDLSRISYPTVLLLATYMSFAAGTYAVFLLFPSGRFAPRWSWLLLLGYIITEGIVKPLWSGGPPFVSGPFFYVAAMVCQVYRYRRVSTPAQRQQTKWIVVCLIASLLASVAVAISIQTRHGEVLYFPLATLLYQLSLLCVPIAFFLAIQRYRLYEIDALINRALVYGSLTGLLGALYVGLIIGLQALVRAVTGQDSPVAIVASTLVIAGLFQPLRSRIQRLIDQRFYRRKYDAQKTLAAFSATLRQEVSLTELQERLVGVLNETLQPEHVSLWLRPPERPTQPLLREEQRDTARRAEMNRPARRSGALSRHMTDEQRWRARYHSLSFQISGCQTPASKPISM